MPFDLNFTNKSGLDIILIVEYPIGTTVVKEGLKAQNTKKIELSEADVQSLKVKADAPDGEHHDAEQELYLKNVEGEPCHPKLKPIDCEYVVASIHGKIQYAY